MSRLVSAEEARGLLEALNTAEVPYRSGWIALNGGGIATRNGVSIGECWSAAVTQASAAAPDLAATVIALTDERDSERANGNDLADAVVRLEAERDRLREVLACERGELARLRAELLSTARARP